jgi:predicted nucleic acid-binding protein
VLVVDASAIVEVVLHTDAGLRVIEAFNDNSLHAPDIIGLEVVSVVRRLLLSDELTRSEARRAISDFRDIGVETYDHGPLLERCLQLAPNTTPYDAAYIALAEGLRVPVLTCDRKLAGVPGTHATFRLVD